MLRGHVGLGKSRLETLCMLVVGMIGARSINLTHIASASAKGVQIASTYRRLQRFFQHVDLGPDWAAAIIARLVGATGDWTLALDRTTWKIGARKYVTASDATHLNFAAKRLKGEWLIVVSNIPGSKALAACRKRWAIECLFGDAKTRGLNIEDTRLTDPASSPCSWPSSPSPSSGPAAPLQI